MERLQSWIFGYSVVWLGTGPKGRKRERAKPAPGEEVRILSEGRIDNTSYWQRYLVILKASTSAPKPPQRTATTHGGRAALHETTKLPALRFCDDVYHLFDLIPEAVESIGSREAMFSFFAGVAVFGVLEEVIMPAHDHDEEDGHDHEHEKMAKDSPTGKKGGKNNVNSKGKKADSLTTTPTEPALSAKERRDLLRSSLITFVAFAMHNLPEGLSVYLAALSDLRLGTQLTVAILIHNTPEGMTVAVPLYAATGNTTSVLWWTLLNGLAEPLGVVAGGWLLHGYLLPQLLSRCLAGVGGIMACILIHELQPTVNRYSGKTIATSAFFGGMVVCFGALEA